MALEQSPSSSIKLRPVQELNRIQQGVVALKLAQLCEAAGVMQAAQITHPQPELEVIQLARDYSSPRKANRTLGKQHDRVISELRTGQFTSRPFVVMSDRCIAGVASLADLQNPTTAPSHNAVVLGESLRLDFWLGPSYEPAGASVLEALRQRVVDERNFMMSGNEYSLAQIADKIKHYGPVPDLGLQRQIGSL